MHNPLMPNFSHAIFFVLQGLVAFFMLLVIIGLIFLLVRFLLTATTAAKLYIANNTPVEPSAPPVVEKPATKPRTPKAPPVE